ncbi:MAG: YbjN domain-containing protein [Verrucomicrobia bacterium]|nr:YbjN domain-containing protein [Verrucomicrobiota bacterium]
MKHLRRLLVAAALLVLPCASNLRAEQGEIIKDLSVANIERMLDALKLEYKEVQPGIYRFTIGGYKVLLFNKGNNLQFYASFKKKVTFGRVNEWNASQGRYTRAYLDKDGDPCIEADLDISGGVAYGTLAVFFDKWIKNLARFTQHIDFR